MDKAYLTQILTTYADNYDRQIELRETLINQTDRQEWQEAYRRRADALSGFFEENEAVIQALQEAMREPLTEETAEFLYQEITHLFQRRCVDACLISPILEQLIPFYEEAGNTERMIRIYEAAFQTLSLSAARDGYLPLTCYDYAEKIFDLKDQYAAIPDPRGRITFFEIYNCVCGVETGFEYYGPEKASQYFQEMLALWHSEDVRKLDGDRKTFQWYVDMTKALWVTNIGNCIEQVSPAIQELFVKLAEEQFASESAQCDELFQYDYNIYENHLRVMILRGEISREEGIRRVYRYYRERISRLSVQTDDGDNPDETNKVNIGELSYDEIRFLLDAPCTISKWTVQCGQKTLPAEMLETITDTTHTIVYKTLINTPGQENEINDALSVYCFSLLPFLRNREEKEKWLFDLVVRRQLPTYIHCSMVQHLSAAIFEEMFRDRPELFQDVCRLMAPEELPEFISKCAIFHDVGKNKIAGIINTQTRAIRDNEFEAIQQHPAHGYRFIYADKDFSRYKDVALGHHKFYNGKGGYPKDFDNTASPYRSVIDLITLCDCLDAATDRLGRNYKKAKTADEVFAEFQRDKGVRYNPDMVDYICGSEALKRKLRRLVSEERIDIAYEIYSDFVG